jgi:hypothetical protein
LDTALASGFPAAGAKPKDGDATNSNQRGPPQLAGGHRPPKKAPLGAGQKGCEMGIDLTRSSLQLRMSQLGMFHWPDLDLRVAYLGQYRG